MSHYFNEYTFRNKVDTCLEKVRLILDSNRTSALATPDSVPHKYEDKYLLANYLVNTAAACHLNSLSSLGFQHNQLVTLKSWSKDKDVSFRFEALETCEFIKEVSRQVDSANKYVSEASFGGRVVEKFTSKVVTTVVDYIYKFKVTHSLIAFRGVGDKPEDRIQIASRDAVQDITLRVKNFPYPEHNKECWDVNVSWLFRNMNDSADQLTFAIDRSKTDCFTPARNRDITEVEIFFANVNVWSEMVSNYFEYSLFQVQTSHTENSNLDLSALNTNGIFVPVVPLWNNAESAATSSAPHLWEALDSSVAPPSSELVQMSSAVTAPQTVGLSAETVNTFLHEQERSLKAKSAEMTTQFATAGAHDLITAVEAVIVVVCKHLRDVVAHLREGIAYVEDLLYKQLISAVGKELQPSDFGAYMRFHNRKLLRELYQPAPFVHSVRRSPAHSPEGTLRIEDALAGGSTSSVAEPIYTVAHSTESGASRQMEFTLNAATKVRFGGDRHLHGFLAHSFSGQQQPQLNLVAQARQFSSFIVLIGRIASATLFEPKYGFIVQNKDEVVIPLLLETLPTPKQFRDAIESLSPEQQRFAQAFRSMQLESTLFGVCVVQIKPQLEKVLNLAPDSLTKEIQLTQDLMKLFIEYQIPTDLMSFDGAASATAADRLTAVKGHVKAMNEMLFGLKTQEIEEKNKEREYLRGPPPPPGAVMYSMAPPPMPNSLSLSTRGGAAPGMKMKKAADASFYGEARSRNVAPSASASVAYSAAPMMDLMSFDSAPVSMSCQADPFSAPSGALRQQSQPTSTVHVVVNAPNQTNPQNTHQTPQQKNNDSAGGVAVDFTKFPTLLDRNYEKFDTDSALRPTILNVGTTWTKKAQAALLASQTTKSLGADEQTKEKTAAFDLLDALSRSGALTIEDASLHVVIAATHSFDKSLMDTVVQGNVNPIERVERSTLILASTLHGLPASEMVNDAQLERVSTYAPTLFIKN